MKISVRKSKSKASKRTVKGVLKRTPKATDRQDEEASLEAIRAGWKDAEAIATAAHDVFIAKLKAADPTLVEAFKEYRHGWGARQRYVNAVRAEISQEVAALRGEHEALSGAHERLARGSKRQKRDP